MFKIKDEKILNRTISNCMKRILELELSFYQEFNERFNRKSYLYFDKINPLFKELIITITKPNPPRNAIIKTLFKLEEYFDHFN